MTRPEGPVPVDSLRDIVDAEAAAFLDLYGPELADPEACRDRCEFWSERFVAHLRELGVAADVISGARFGEVPEFPGVALLLAGHFAAQVDLDGEAWVWDWTARQFDPLTDCPVVVPLAQWRATWRDPRQPN